MANTVYDYLKETYEKYGASSSSGSESGATEKKTVYDYLAETVKLQETEYAEKQEKAAKNVQSWLDRYNSTVNGFNDYASKAKDDWYADYGENWYRDMLGVLDDWDGIRKDAASIGYDSRGAYDDLKSLADSIGKQREYYASLFQTQEEYDQYRKQEEMLGVDLNTVSQEIADLKQQRSDYIRANVNDRRVTSKKDAYLQGIKDWDAKIAERENYFNEAKELQTQKAMLGADLNALQREVESLTARRERYAQDHDFDWTDQGQRAAHEAYLQEQDSLIAQKKQHLNRARYLQEQAKLSGVADRNSEYYDPEFRRYSQYQSTQKENPAWWESGVGDTQYEWINNLNGFRDQYERTASDLDRQAGAPQKPRFAGETESAYYQKGYDQLTKDEISIYNYYYSRYGKEKAQDYLDSIQETLNYRKAAGMYAGMEDDVAQELIFGVEAGLDQFQSGISSLLNTEDDYIPFSATQMASGMVREDLADFGPKLPKVLGGASLGQVAYDTVTTTANMAPSMISSMAIGMLNPVAGEIAGNVLLGASAAGNAYQEMRNCGYDKDSSRAYSALVGASEAGLQYLLGGIGKLGGTLSGNAIAKITEGVDNAFLRTAIQLGGNMLSEGTEEGLQEILTPWFQNLVFHADENVNWDEVAYSSLLGALTAGFMEGGETISGEVNTYRSGRQLQKAGVSGKELADIGNTFSADTVAYKLAGKVNENTDAYTLGRLFQEIDAQITEANIADIQMGLEQKGFPENTARKNAEVFANVVAGANFTDRQIAVIESNETLAETVREVIIDRNSTVNQRTKGYNEVLAALAREKSGEVSKTASQNTSRTEQDSHGQKNEEATAKVSTTEKDTSETDTGPSVVKKISSIQNGNIRVTLQDGTESRVQDADIAPEDGVRIETVAGIEGITAEDANFILQTLRTNAGTSAQADALGAKEAYTYGYFGYSEDHIAKHGVFANSLTKPQRDAIYQLGQKARARDGNTISPRQAKYENGAKAGIYFESENGVVSFQEAGKKNLSEKQEAGVRTAMVLNKLGIGGDIIFYESYKNSSGEIVYEDRNGVERKAPNGFYSEDGSIHVDLNAGAKSDGLVLYTMSHELTHFIEQWSPQKFKVLADFLIENYEKGTSMDSLVRLKREKIAKLRGVDAQSIPYKEAYSEVIADSMEAMLSDGNVLDKLVSLKARDSSIFGKMKQFFDNLAQKIRKAYEGVRPDSAEGRAVLEMRDSVERIQSLFAEALVDASENYRGTDVKENTAQEGGVKYQARQAGYDYSKPFSQQIDDYKNGIIPSGDTLIVGATPDIFKQIGFNALPMSINTTHVDYALKGTKDADHYIGESMLKQLPDKIKKPVAVFVSQTKKNTSVVALLPFTVNAKQIVSPIAIDGFGVNNRIVFDSNSITSVYGKTTAIKQLNQAVQDEANGKFSLLYIKKNEAITLLHRAGYQLSGSLIPHDGFIHSIRENASPVKAKFKNATEAQQFKRWFGDWQNHPHNASKVVNADGTPMVVYHQTGNDFTVFDPKHSGAGSSDQQTPFGIFLKTSDKDIGVNGQKQMPLYANIRNPMRVSNRSELTKKLKGLSSDYSSLCDDYNTMNAEFKKKQEEAGKALDDYMSQWRKENPKASRRDIYEDETFERLSDAEDEIIDQWEQKDRELSTKMKTVITKALKDAGYDGVFLSDDSGSWGRKTDAIIALDPEQVKSATDNIGTFDGSNPDIRYSDRDPEAVKVNQVLQKENAKLKEDVSYLKELLKLQRQVTGGTKFTKTSVEAAAGLLMKSANAKGNKAEFAKILNGFYEYIAKGDDLTWEGVSEQAQRAAQWLQEHENIKKEIDGYAQDILREIRENRFYLDENQKKEAAYQYGSYNEWRKKTMGSTTVANDAKTSLDSLWGALSEKYPNIFDPNTTSTDMPAALLDAIDTLRNMKPMDDYAYDAELAAQDLTRQVYESYWNVSTLYTAADVKQKQINRLKIEHSKRMDALKTDHRNAVAQLKAEHEAELESVREEWKSAVAKQNEIIDKYQKAREKNVDGRKRTAMRNKIKNDVKDLDSLLYRGDKKRNVKDGMRDFAEEALATAEFLFSDEYSDEDMVMAGVGCDVEAWESKLLDETQSLLQQYDDVFVGSYAEHEAEKIIAGDTKSFDARMKYAEKTKRKIAENMIQLKGVFARERSRLNKATVSSMLDNLAKAYKKLGESDDLYIRGATDEDVYQHLLYLSNSIGGTIVKDMSLEQLTQLHEAYTMVITTIRNANKTFTAERNATVRELGQKVVDEVKTVGGKRQYSAGFAEAIRKFGWNNLKPVYAFEFIGSDTFSQIFKNVRAGEDVWAVDVNEARDFYLETAKKYGYNTWDNGKQYEFTSTSGMKFSLNLEQIMSLYAYSKRDQAADHLRIGGIVIDESTEITMKTKLGLKVTVNPTEATAYNISDETLGEIIGKLTPEQKAFVDEMQGYLSTTMGNKGNEVSLEMYGVKLFKEKNYFPLKSAPQYMAKAKEQQEGNVRIKNSGFTMDTEKEADNPIVLTPFMQAWADHVNDMSMYHAFVLPMEDFYRVYNFKTGYSDISDAQSVNAAIQNAYGKGATAYIDQLMKDLNGGGRTDSTTGVINKGMNVYKKGAVFANASVAIQQPSAIARATALVDLKYFIGPKVDHKRHAELWDEVKQYAPVAAIKEMGYFDTNMGKSTQDYLLGKEYNGIKEKAEALFKDSGYRDEALSKLPSLADEVTWCAIWEACKREAQAKNPGMKANSEEFLKKVGDRFTEVIVKTQVYDSVLSRSANMRSKETGMKMATAFMAEPTTSINMAADAILKAKRGDRKYCRRVIGSVVAAQILNAFLVSWVYAARDDDDEESYAEKYIGSFSAEVLDGMNPLTYIPFLKDLASIVRGYDVERSDISAISDLWAACKRLESDDLSPWRKAEGFVGGICQIFGLPVKNIMRDVRAAYQAFETLVNGEKTTARGIQYAVQSAFTGKTVSNAQQLLDARMAGDAEHEERVVKRYKSEKEANNAVRAAIKEKYIAGQLTNSEAVDLMKRYSGLEKDKAYWNADKWEYEKIHGDTEDYEKYGRWYEAIRTGKEIKDVMKSYTDYGVDVSTLKRQITNGFKDEYMAGSTADRANLKGYLLNAYELCGTSRKDAEQTLTDWEFEAYHGKTYEAYVEGYKNGEVSESEIRAILQERGYFKYQADEKVAQWNSEREFKSEFGDSYSDIVESYKEGLTSRDTMMAALRFKGYGDSAAEEQIAEFDIESRFDIDYSELDDAYRAGDISRENFRQAMIDNGTTPKKADQAIETYDWMRDHAEYGLEYSDAWKYAHPIDNYGYSLSDVGLDPNTYLEYKDLKKNCRGVDEDNDGKADSGTKRSAIFEMINALPIRDDQKDALACIDYTLKSVKRYAPWH